VNKYEHLIKIIIKTGLLAGGSIFFIGIGMIFSGLNVLQIMGVNFVGMGFMSMFISLLVWIEKRKIGG